MRFSHAADKTHYAKQGSGFGHTKIQGQSVLVRGLNVPAVTLSTPLAAPVLAATRLRGGSAGSARGAASLIREAIPTARQAGCSGTLMLRGDSAFYSAEVVGACHDQDVRFSVTAKLDPKVKAAITAIDETAWMPIKYPNALFDEQAGGWVSDAEVAEAPYTAFTSKKSKQVAARLIVRRVKKLNAQADRGQDELFTTYRYYPIFTDSPYTLQIIATSNDHDGHRHCAHPTPEGHRTGRDPRAAALPHPKTQPHLWNPSSRRNRTGN